MPEEMTAEDLAEHLELLELTTDDDRDQLLQQLLVGMYPSKRSQDT